MKNPYMSFEKVVFRTPFFKFNFLLKLFDQIQSKEDEFYSFIKKPEILEAIYLASPILYDELKKLDNNLIKDQGDIERIKYSVLRYVSRAATRCTPFGLFAGCSVGKLGEFSKIKLENHNFYRRHTRLDMNFLCALFQDIAKIKYIKLNILYFPNTSIYQMGNKLRFVEYFYSNSRRIHRLASVDFSEYLEKVIKKASEGGAFYHELRDCLIDDEIDIEESSSFIDELIESQLIVSELEPSVTGEEYLIQIINKLQEIEKRIGNKNEINILLNHLKFIEKELNHIDSLPIGTSIDKYNNIIAEIKALGTSYEPKYLFQTDMIKTVIEADIDSSIVTDILDTMDFLNKITFLPNETYLTKFRDDFFERYEQREMPLLQVLDNESGLGYMHGVSGDLNPIIDDLVVPLDRGNSGHSISMNNFQSLLTKKYYEALYKNLDTITLTEEDFNLGNNGWRDLPPTLSVMCEILKSEANEKEICIKSIGGSSAANLLGRFCHDDELIKEHVLEITRTEEKLYSEVIFAEIVHLPESRTGNILLRPTLRPYEIPYLAKPSVGEDNIIELSDLMVSIRKGKIFLRSKKLNKEIIPRLSTAHNFSFKSLPIYHFLCDMQLQNSRGGLRFNWGNIANENNWLPRIKYKNVILSPAKWAITQQDFKNFYTISNNEILIESITKWREKLRIPRYVVLADGDNDLFTDLGSVISVRTLFSVIKKRNSFLLEEFLFDPKHSTIQDNDGVFTNEFIFSFYKANLG